MNRQQIADSLAAHSRTLTPDGKLATDDIPRIDALAAGLALHWPTVAAGGPAAPVPAPAPTGAGFRELNIKIAMETVGHESIVLECYKDNAKPPVWTWGIGITEASGYAIMQFKDNPQTVQKCIEVYVDRCRKVYIPGVLRAFHGFVLSEAQFAAALSFHYNTGAIEKTDWVQLVLVGQLAKARKFLESHYLGGGSDRRLAEAALFFDGKWTNDGFTTVWPVKKPGYTPDWAHGKRVDIRPAIQQVLSV